MSREPITFDSSAWTGMTSRLWPSPKGYPYPRPLQARASSSKRSLSVLGSCLAGLIGMYDHRGPLMGVVPMAHPTLRCLEIASEASL
jgi:hypothetical protein